MAEGGVAQDSDQAHRDHDHQALGGRPADPVLEVEREEDEEPGVRGLVDDADDRSDGQAGMADQHRDAGGEFGARRASPRDEGAGAMRFADAPGADGAAVDSTPSPIMKRRTVT
ncbi:hypothetical protein GCM10027091_30320 [Streptomyces daliensis]